jgi:DNA-binding NarL/FixJ family response regulator
MSPAESAGSAPPLTAVLADDAVIVREGLARMLAAGGVDVVAECADAGQLLAAVARHRPSIAVVDIRMPPTHTREGLEAARTIRVEHPDVAVLILSSYVEVHDAMELLASPGGRVGYLLKESVTNATEFLQAVRTVAGGGSVVDPTVVAELFGRQRRVDPLADMTPREREVLALMAHGKSNAGIARELWVTEGAVEKYVKSILSKLDIGVDAAAHRRVLAVLSYLDSR